jgi:hypothetical protein
MTAKKNPFAVALPALPAVTILVPFDIGQSYALFADKSKVRGEAFDKWEEIFSEDLDSAIWDCTQFPSPFGIPLNYIVRLVYLDPDPKIDLVIKSLPWIHKEDVSIELVFFQLGIGVLTLRATLSLDLLEAMGNFEDDTQSSAFLEAVSPIVTEGISLYKRVLNAEAGKDESERIINRLPHVDRKGDLYIPQFPYPVFFTPNKPPDVSLYTKSEHEFYRYAGNKQEAGVYIGWEQAYVEGASSEFRLTIDIDFTIGITTWYSLITMNRHSSFHLMRALSEMGRQNKSLRKQESSDIRFTYMDAANSLYPVLWTSQERDLGLLEKIHNIWSSERLWKNVAEQTELLALHHDELESTEKEKRNQILEGVGLLIAIAVIPSGIADILHQVPEKNLGPWPRLAICIIGTLAVIVFTFSLWMRLRGGQQGNSFFAYVVQRINQMKGFDATREKESERT